MKILILIGLLSLNCASQETNCSDFKTGKFAYTDPNYTDYTITRNDTLQIERNLKTGLEIHTIINWTSDCEFELKYSRILNVDRDVSDIIGKKIIVKILSTDGTKYKARVKSDAIDSMVEFKKV